MAENVKILLSIELQGGSLVSKRDNSKDNNIPRKRVLLTKPKKRRKNIKKTGTPFFPLEAQPAKKVIKLSREAYNHFIDKENPPFWEKRPWAKLTKKQRIQSHCSRIAQHERGISFRFEILPD